MEKKKLSLNKDIDKYNFPIEMTKKAIEIASKGLLQEKKNKNILRISVKGGGCAGLKYLLNFVKNKDNLDISKNIIMKILLIIMIFLEIRHKRKISINSCKIFMSYF